MRTISRPALALALATLALLVVRPAQAQGADRILTLMNQQRAANGLPALARSYDLDLSAAREAVDMAFRMAFEDDPSLGGTHMGSDGSTIGQRIQATGYVANAYAENIGWGFNGSPDSMMNWWMNSAPHRANILNPSLKDCGIAIAYNPRSVYGYYFCVDFGASSGPPTAYHPVNARNPGFFHP
jgi:uncharacterized protein YkwD